MFKNKAGKVRTGWRIVVILAIFYLILIGISLLRGLLEEVVLSSGGNLYMQNNAVTEEGIQFIKTMDMVTSFIQVIVMIIIPIVAWKKFMNKPLSNMGLTSIKVYSKELIAGLIFGALSMSLVFFLLILSNNAKVLSWTPYISSDTFLYLLLYILVGFAEEVYGRGFIMATLRETKSLVKIILISAVIFALLHSGNSGIGILPYINITLAGILFAYMYIKSGNLWMCIGYHITWDYFLGNVFGFLVSGQEIRGILTTVCDKSTIINGGTFGPEGGLIVTAIFLAGFLFVKLYYKNTHYSFLTDELQGKR